MSSLVPIRFVSRDRLRCRTTLPLSTLNLLALPILVWEEESTAAEDKWGEESMSEGFEGWDWAVGAHFGISEA